jgi:hypothetical protein
VTDSKNPSDSKKKVETPEQIAKRIQECVEEAKMRGVHLPNEALVDADFPPFVLVVGDRRLVTNPSARDVSRLLHFGKISGKWPELYELVLKLRIRKADLRSGVRSYVWTEMEVSDDTISLGEWAMQQRYNRRDSSHQLERAPVATSL